MRLLNRVLTSAVLLVSCAGAAASQPLLVENFDHPGGDPLTSHGWTSIRGGASILVSNGGLSRTGYAYSGRGNAADLITDAGQEVSRSFGVLDTGSVYAAFLVELDSVSTVSNQGLFLYLGPTGTDIFNRRATVYVNGDGTGNVRFGINKSSGIQFTGYDHSLGTVHLIVLKYEFVLGGADVVSLWVDPDLDQPEPPTADASTSSGTDALELAEIVLSQIPTGSPTATVDGLYVGTTWPPSDHVFSDDFESGTLAGWSEVVP